jgi:aspartyl-tRNA(Asn)/glutamyl-tRNA(Gln) amidotransferase subunit A
MGGMTEPLAERIVRGASLCQTLHWLAQGRLDAKQLTATYLAAIERTDPRLHAYVSVQADAARDAAAVAALRRGTSGAIGRLDGVPLSVKDNIDVAGLATTCGLPTRRNATATTDAACVARLRAAGAVILGKTNLDEGVLGAATTNPHYGATQNPLRAGVSAGGSSGGAAAAVAAGLCVAAIASDSLWAATRGLGSGRGCANRFGVRRRVGARDERRVS